MQTKREMEVVEMEPRAGGELMVPAGTEPRERGAKSVVHGGREGVPLAMGISRDRVRRVLRTGG